MDEIKILVKDKSFKRDEFIQKAFVKSMLDTLEEWDGPNKKLIITELDKVSN